VRDIKLVASNRWPSDVVCSSRAKTPAGRQPGETRQPWPPLMEYLLSLAGSPMFPTRPFLIRSIWLSSLGLSVARAAAGQCVTTPNSCRELITVRRGHEGIVVYANRPLTAPSDTVTRAIVVLHGAGSSGRFEFRSVLASTFLSGNVANTLVVAPHFASNDGAACKDSIAVNELNWNCDVAAGDWRMGGRARNDSTLSSFDAVDAILLAIANRTLFPNLSSIVVAGHSAGGQLVTLYQAVNQIDEKLGVPTSYVVANASAYAYLDARRPTPVRSASSDGPPRFEFNPFVNASGCPNYARWPFGLDDRTGYAARLSASQLKENVARRPVTYLLGDADTVTASGGFFGSCAAMAQGGNRQARGMAFAQYASEFSPEHRHKVIIVDGCGHDARCIFTSDDALPALFPKVPR